MSKNLRKANPVWIEAEDGIIKIASPVESKTLSVEKLLEDCKGGISTFFVGGNLVKMAIIETQLEYKIFFWVPQGRIHTYNPENHCEHFVKASMRLGRMATLLRVEKLSGDSVWNITMDYIRFPLVAWLRDDSQCELNLHPKERLIFLGEAESEIWTQEKDGLAIFGIKHQAGYITVGDIPGNIEVSPFNGAILLEENPRSEKRPFEKYRSLWNVYFELTPGDEEPQYSTVIPEGGFRTVEAWHWEKGYEIDGFMVPMYILSETLY